MSDTYHYDEGAIHNDHKRVIHIETLGGADVGKLIGAFLKNDIDIEDAEIVEDTDNIIPPAEPEEELKQPWFAEVRTDEGYDAAWTDAFVKALMESEYGEQIARDWSAKRSRHTLIKVCVIGLLKDNGVLKGSNRAIARMIVSENPNYGRNKTNDAKEANNLSRKMSNGWNQPYALWVKKYVEGNNKPKE